MKKIVQILCVNVWLGLSDPAQIRFWSQIVGIADDVWFFIHRFM